MLLMGDFTDFGYNNCVVVGVTNMERELNISGTTIVNFVESEQQAIETIIRLANFGYALITSTSSEHGNRCTTWCSGLLARAARRRQQGSLLERVKLFKC